MFLMIETVIFIDSCLKKINFLFDSLIEKIKKKTEKKRKGEKLKRLK